MGAEIRAEQDSPVAGRTATSGRSDPVGLSRAHRLYWLAFGLFLVAVVVGLAWDRAWHATHAFDTFYSPPQLFVYSPTALPAGLVAVLAFSPGLRGWLGPPRRGFPLPFAVPGAALAFVRLLTRRTSLFLVAVALWSVLTTLNDRAVARRLELLTPDGRWALRHRRHAGPAPRLAPRRAGIRRRRTGHEAGCATARRDRWPRYAVPARDG